MRGVTESNGPAVLVVVAISIMALEPSLKGNLGPLGRGGSCEERQGLVPDRLWCLHVLVFWAIS